MHYLHILFFVCLLWRYVFKPPAFPKASLIQKLLHSAALFYIGLGCWSRTFVTWSIMLEPAKLLHSLQLEKRFYPLWIDIVIQPLAAIVGPAGLFCGYWAMRGREKHRRLLLALIPFMYLVDCYFVARKSFQLLPAHAGRISFIACFITGVSYCAIFLFYRDSGVIHAFFDNWQEGKSRSTKNP
jgi:hypothetical protein